jgi:hypothetical protein
MNYFCDNNFVFLFCKKTLYGIDSSLVSLVVYVTAVRINLIYSKCSICLQKNIATEMVSVSVYCLNVSGLSGISGYLMLLRLLRTIVQFHISLGSYCYMNYFCDNNFVFLFCKKTLYGIDSSLVSHN